MKITITNGYSWLNKGDAGIAIALGETIREAYPDCQLDFVSLTPSIDAREYSPALFQVIGHSLEDLFDKRQAKLLRGLRFARQVVSNGRGTDYRQSISASDLVVGCGGGYLNDSWGQIVRVHFTQLDAAFAEGVPTVLANQSVGPFHTKLMRRTASRALGRVETVISRELISQALVRALGVPPERSPLAPDLAFGLSPPSAAHHDEAGKLLQDLSGPLLGITVRAWSFRDQPDPAAAQARYLEAVADALVDFLRRQEGTAVFLPQVIGPGADDDRLAARMVRQLLPDGLRDRTRLLEEDLHPQVLRALLARMQVLLGTRMHSNIFAVSLGTPVVAIGYEHKTQGIMDMLGLAEFYTEINTVKASDLSPRLDAAWGLSRSKRTALKQKAASLGGEAKGVLQAALRASQ